MDDTATPFLAIAAHSAIKDQRIDELKATAGSTGSSRGGGSN
jgi:hypothetical protein